MKLLLFSDLHCDAPAAQAIVDRADAFDVVVGAGDFSTCRLGIEKTIDVLRAITVPTVVVPGNGESLEELAKACRGWDSVHVLHGTGATIAGVPFFGLGGGVPVTPFGAWSYDFTEQQAAALLADCPEACVLVSHSPPKHVVDVDASGNSLGSTAVRATIEAKKPLVCVCGHIHACWRQIGEIGATQVVNAGPIGIEWTVNV